MHTVKIIRKEHETILLEFSLRSNLLQQINIIAKIFKEKVMKKSNLIYSFMILIGNCFYMQAQYSGAGDGTESNPYEITNASQLDEMRNYLGQTGSNTHFRLMNDIDLDTYITTQYPILGWLPIGSNADNMEAFQ